MKKLTNKEKIERLETLRFANIFENLILASGFGLCKFYLEIYKGGDLSDEIPEIMEVAKNDCFRKNRPFGQYNYWWPIDSTWKHFISRHRGINKTIKLLKKK